MSAESLSDGELVGACLEGRKEAWDEFVARYSRLVWWSVRRALERTAYSGRQDVCEDAFQDVFRTFLEEGALSKLRNAESVKKYLSVASAHRALDRVKALSRADRRSQSVESAETDADRFEFCVDGDASRDAESSERNAAVDALLVSLKPRERICLEMHYLENRTHREIAEFLGIPQDTVSALIRRVKERIRSKSTGLKDFL